MDIETLRLEVERFRAVLELEKFDVSTLQRDISGHSQLAADFAHISSRQCHDFVTSLLEKAEKDQDLEYIRRLKALRAWVVQAFTDHEVRSIDQEIANKAHQTLQESNHGHRLRDAKLLLSETDDPLERIKLDNARVQAAKELIPLLAERLGISHGIARSFGRESYLHLWAECMQLDPNSLKTLAHDILQNTDDMYKETLGWAVRKRLGCSLEDAHRRDMPHIFASRYTDYEESFTVKGIVSTLREFLSRMGVQLDCDGRLSVVINQPKRRPHRAFVCAPRIPHDVRLVLQATDGQRDFQKVLSALGRALFIANISPDAPFEDRVLGDGSLDLTYSRIFQNLLLDRAWLKRCLALSRPKDYVVATYTERLYDVRLVCARLLYELELHEKGSISNMPERFTEIFQRAIIVKTPPELFLHEVRRPFISAYQLRARVYEALYKGHLEHYFNSDWWQNPRSGPFLKKDWSQGRKLSIETRASNMGYQELDIKPLIKSFMQNL